MTAPAITPAPTFYCLGYAGPRVLGPGGDSGASTSSNWNRQLGVALETVARGLRARLPAHRPVCIVGSLAQGADLAIAESLLAHGAVLRAWLPEPLDRFANETDFRDARDRARVGSLTAHPQLSEVRVVSSASDRRERFAECAGRIVRDSDALLCVRHWDAANGRGGTEETIALATALGRPIVEIRLDQDPALAAVVSFPAQWKPHADAGPLPFPRPDPRALVAAWKAAASAEASRSKLFIVRAAAWTVGLQLFATLFALLTFEEPRFEVASLLVKLSVILTAGGIAFTSARRGLSSRWAGRRLAAELQRSWNAVRGFQGAATWLEDDLPVEFAGHGRDLALFHGLDRGANPAHVGGDSTEGEAVGTEELARFREHYARERLAGQHTYAETTARGSLRGQRILQAIFYASLAVTLAALFTKLGLRAAGAVAAWEGLDRACSLVSILGPTLGAAALSFIALLDLAARGATQERLAQFLALQARELAASTDWAATRQVVVATERRLLAEVKSWHARHAFRR